MRAATQKSDAKARVDYEGIFPEYKARERGGAERTRVREHRPSEQQRSNTGKDRVRYHLIESLILAQDERWRRA